MAVSAPCVCLCVSTATQWMASATVIWGWDELDYDLIAVNAILLLIVTDVGPYCLKENS